MPLCLLPIKGGQPIVLDAPELVLGRHPECDRVIRGYDSVSRRHCRLVPQGHYVQVSDLGSLNGVRVNGHKIQQDVPLAPGDRLRLGSAEFVLALQSEAALESAQHRPATTIAADLRVTQPIPPALQEDEAPAEGNPAVVPAQSPPTPVAAARKRRSPPSAAPREPAEARETPPATGNEPPAKDYFTDKSWDMIVALERRAPELPPPKAAAALEEEEHVSAERAVTLGYVSRPSAGPSWNTARWGLSTLCWSGIAAGMVWMLIWEACSVPVFLHSTRTATSVFIPFGDGTQATADMAASYGLQMVLLGGLPVIVCVVMRNSVEDAFWPAVTVAVLGLVFGQVMRPGNAQAINVLCHAALLLLLAALAGMLVGTCLACRLPRRSGLSAWGLLAAAAIVLATALAAVVLKTDSTRIVEMTLPVRRPASQLLVLALFLVGVAAQGLVLYFMRQIAMYLKSAPLTESVDTCLVYAAVASLGGFGCWLVVTNGSVESGWADTLLIAAAAGGTVSLAWIGQTAGHVRSQLG